jgi:hypothetical protein
MFYFNPFCIFLFREDIRACRQKLAKDIKRCENLTRPEDREANMADITETFKTSLKDINNKIFNYNLIVPILDKQMMTYNFEKEYKRVSSNIQEYLPEGKGVSYHGDIFKKFESPQKVSYSDLWTAFKDIFKTNK